MSELATTSQKITNEWYKQDVEDVLRELKSSDAQGLSAEQVRALLEQYGPNELVERGIKSRWQILWEQLTDVMVLILIASGVVSAFVGELEDTIVIIAIVVLNSLLGMTQEYRAEQAIAALKRLAVPVVRVRRNGNVEEISARELVPGDVVILEAGNLVPADGRLIASANLRVQEAALTGESEPVEKQPGTIDRNDLPLGDQHNMAYMGTVVTYGRGRMVVTGTGMETQLGHIANMLQSVAHEQTPLQRRLDGLGKTLAWIALIIVVVILGLGLLTNDAIREAVSAGGGIRAIVSRIVDSGALGELLLTGISLAVAAVPEGLPAVVTITLALGSRRMLKRNALIRKLPAVETLGSVTVICSDKTGTLTENRMTVTVLDVVGKTIDVDTLLRESVPVLDRDTEVDREARPPERSLGLLLRAMSLANDAVLQPASDGSGNWRAVGDPTEGALVVAAAQVGFMKDDLERRWPRVNEIPFTSERKRMTTIHRVRSEVDPAEAPWGDAPYVAFVKGAVDGLLEISDHVWAGDQNIVLDETMRQRINASNEEMAQRGERVLGVAFRPLTFVPSEVDEVKIEQGLIFIGLVGMMDPPRPEVKEAVRVARQAGIRPVMITGDHPLTARHIAKDLGIATNDKFLTGPDLANMSLEELEKVVGDVSVYARVSPEHKLNIVQALQDKGQVVAMTGDGVNDAPALKKADIGVAMGITGTDVSKEAADMVLLDDNFATIVSAVEEGRVIYDNIRKFIKYILSSNTAEVLTMLVGPILGMPLPLLPLQILWVNLVTDGLPGLALAVEPAEKGIMQRSPYRPNESIFSRGIGRQILWIGIVIGLVSLIAGYPVWRDQPCDPHIETGCQWQTMVFTTLTLAQMGNVLATRSTRQSFFSLGLMSNRPMIGAVLLTIALQLMVVYVPPMQNLFHTTALSMTQLGICFLLGSIVFWAAELEKWLLRRGILPETVQA
jgi:Ca2+-transporting ATPase